MNWGGHLVVALTLAIALGLSSAPVGEPVALLWPDWVLLTLAYWCLAAPHRYGLTLAFVTGLLQDVTAATLLGLHALIYVLAMYVLIANHLRLRLMPLWMQSMVILGLAGLSVLLQFWVEGPATDLSANLWALVPAVTTALFWAPIFLCLRYLRLHFAIA